MLPSSLQFLQAIHHAGGELAYDVDAISARLGLPKMYARKYIGGCIDRELLTRIDRGTGSVLKLTPTGLDAAMVRKPVQPVAAKPSPPPSATPAPAPRLPPSSAPPSRPIRNRPHDRMPALTNREMLLRKQDNEIHTLRTIRHFNGVPDNTEHIDRGRLYLDREQLGADLAVTVEQYRQFKDKTKSFPSSFIPGGLTERQAKAIRDKVTRPVRTAAENKRKQAKAAAKVATKQTVTDLDCRASAVYLVLTDQPQTMAEIMDKVARSPAFRTADGNSLLTACSPEARSRKQSNARSRKKSSLPVWKSSGIGSKTGDRWTCSGAVDRCRFQPQIRHFLLGHWDTPKTLRGNVVRTLANCGFLLGQTHPILSLETAWQRPLTSGRRANSMSAATRARRAAERRRADDRRLRPRA